MKHTRICHGTFTDNFSENSFHFHYNGGLELFRYVNLSRPDVLDGVNNFLHAMVLFQHPMYSRITPYLEKSSHILNTLSIVNLTDFMLQVWGDRPLCSYTSPIPLINFIK